jgi:hypothetical protein
VRFEQMAALLLSLDGWADIAEMVTGAGVLLVLYQVYQARRDSEVQLVTDMTTMMLEVDRALIEYPEMRPYIGGGREVPDDGAERERAFAICTALANALDHVVFHLDYMNEDSQTAWRIYIAETYLGSPVLRKLMLDHPYWWPGLQGQISGSDR